MSPGTREEAMLFHVTMHVRIPPDADEQKVSSLSAQDHQRAAELQRASKWLHLWRVAGKFANVSIFRAAQADCTRSWSRCRSAPTWRQRYRRCAGIRVH
jgi:muconolactone delta-isomerase